MVDSTSEVSIQKVANDFAVSKEVIARKFLDLGEITEREYLNFKTKWDNDFKNTGKSGGDFYGNELSEIGKTYTMKVLSESWNGALGDSKAANYLNIKFMRFSNLEAEVFV